jgi:HTH-type transcriptional regulator/antitoxin HigA
MRLSKCELGDFQEWGQIIWAYEEVNSSDKRQKIEAELETRKWLSDRQVKEAKNRNWFQLPDDLHLQRQLVEEFLGGSTAQSFFRSRLKSPATDLWVARVKQIAAHQNVSVQFEEDPLHPLVMGLMLNCESPDFLKRIRQHFNSHGVRFVILKQLKGMRVDGALIRDEKGPIIALTLRFDRIDWFWFTLLHEVGHLMNHWSENRDFIDTLDEASTDKLESEADEFAKSRLIPQDLYDRFVMGSNGIFSSVAIIGFARHIRRPPAIVVGRLQRDGFIPFSHHRALLDQVSKNLEKWPDEEWEVFNA